MNMTLVFMSSDGEDAIVVGRMLPEEVRTGPHELGGGRPISEADLHTLKGHIEDWLNGDEDDDDDE
jgi:hypothetical protein